MLSQIIAYFLVCLAGSIQIFLGTPGQFAWSPLLPLLLFLYFKFISNSHPDTSRWFCELKWKRELLIQGPCLIYILLLTYKPRSFTPDYMANLLGIPLGAVLCLLIRHARIVSYFKHDFLPFLFLISCILASCFSLFTYSMSKGSAVSYQLVLYTTAVLIQDRLSDIPISLTMTSLSCCIYSLVITLTLGGHQQSLLQWYIDIPLGIVFSVLVMAGCYLSAKDCAMSPIYAIVGLYLISKGGLDTLFFGFLYIMTGVVYIVYEDRSKQYQEFREQYSEYVEVVGSVV